MTKNAPASFRYPNLTQFLTLYLPTAVLLTAMFLLAALYHRSMVRREIEAKEAGLAVLLKNAISSDMAARSSDASFLASFLALHLERLAPLGANLREIAKELSLFVENDPSYSGICLLDAAGAPIIRLRNAADGITVTIPNSPGHPEGAFARYVAPPGGTLPSGTEILPGETRADGTLRPTIRFLRPMFGAYGVPLGLLILDYVPSRIFDIVNKEMDRGDGALWLVNAQGEPLAEAVRDEGAKALSGKALTRAWPRILNGKTGQFSTEDGLFTVEKVFTASSPATGDVWRAVAFVPPSAFTPQWFKEAMALHAALLLFLAVTTWFWATARLRKLEAEKALRANEAKLSAISESSLDAVIMIDGEDRVEYWNPAAERMFGYAPGEALGRKCHDLIVGCDDRAAAMRGMEAFAESGEGRLVDRLTEVTGLRKDGERVPLELAISPFKLDGSWRAVGSIRDITRRKEDEARLWELATTDGLTGAANRRHFMEEAAKGLELAKRYAYDAAFVMLDVDLFKDVNDVYGHDAGDEVLRELVAISRATLRETDFFGRVGGEEFAVFMPHASQAAALAAAERLRAAVETARIIFKHKIIPVTISLGAAVFDPASDTLDRLYSRADKALYAAKKDGRNAVAAA